MKKIAFLMLVLCSFGAIHSVASVSMGSDPVGTWTYKAPNAPEGYGSGDIVIAREKDVIKASLKFGDYEVKGTSVKFEKEVLTFTLFLEGEYIRIQATFTGDEMKGSASYSEGEVPFTGKKKVIKK